jgi:hypothetical protein
MATLLLWIKLWRKFLYWGCTTLKLTGRWLKFNFELCLFLEVPPTNFLLDVTVPSTKFLLNNTVWPLNTIIYTYEKNSSISAQFLPQGDETGYSSGCWY